MNTVEPKYRHIAAMGSTNIAVLQKNTAPPEIAETSSPILAADARYIAKLAETSIETVSALKLRHEVFNVEIGGALGEDQRAAIEYDRYDLSCKHLVVTDRWSGKTVGTYRLNTLETAQKVEGFYSWNEFTIDDLPLGIVHEGIEIGRACVTREHRNTKVLFLLWKALLAYQQREGKRYFFGCCSLFTRDIETGRRAYRRLLDEGYFHDEISVVPRANGLSAAESSDARENIELPALFNMYLRLGARVCGPPMVDREFGTIDFFVLFDVGEMSDRYRRIFA